MQSEYPNKHEEAELVAEYICSRLEIAEPFEINKANQMVLPPKKPNDLLNLNRIIEAVHNIYIRDVSEKALSSSGLGGIWEPDTDVSRKRWREAYRDFVSSETNDTLDGLIWLKQEVDLVLEERLGLNDLHIVNSSEILWRNTIVMEDLLYRIAVLASAYEEMPFREKAFEIDLLRCFYYAYGNTACQIFISNLYHPYHLCDSASISGCKSFVAIDGYEIQDLTGYTNKSRSFFSDINFELIWNNVLKLGAFVLPFWFLYFPAYTEREFYLALFLGFYAVSRLNSSYEQSFRKRNKRERKIKTRLIDFSKRVSLLMSFSIDGKPIPIKTLLESRMTNLKFGRESLEIPPAIKNILIRANTDGEETIG